MFLNNNHICTKNQKAPIQKLKSKLHMIFLLFFVAIYCFQPMDAYAKEVWKTGKPITIYMIVDGVTNQTVTVTPSTQSNETDCDEFQKSKRTLTSTINRPNPSSTVKPYISSMSSNNYTKNKNDIGHGDSNLYIYGRCNLSLGGMTGYSFSSYVRRTVSGDSSGYVINSGNGTTQTNNPSNKTPTVLSIYQNAYFDFNIKNGGITGIGAKNSTQASGCYVKYYYTANKYTLTANANGGTLPATNLWSGSGNTSSCTVTYHGKYWIPNNPTRTGYTFAGWYTAASGGTQVTTATTYSTAGNSTIYAHWTANKYTLTLDAKGGKVNGKNTDTKTVTYDSAYGDLPTPERHGYAFDGWFTSADSSDTAVESGTSVKATDTYKTAGNQTLYAHWTLTKRITYNSNGGIGDTVDFDVRVNVPTTYYNGAAFTRKDTNIGTSYTLVGWSTEQFTTKVMFKPGQSFTPTSDRYLYAVWRKTGTGFIQLPRYCGDMFTNDVVLKGGNGTVYNSDYIDGRRAHIDGTDPRGTGEPNAYFSLRQD